MLFFVRLFLLFFNHSFGQKIIIYHLLDIIDIYRNIKSSDFFKYNPWIIFIICCVWGFLKNNQLSAAMKHDLCLQHSRKVTICKWFFIPTRIFFCFLSLFIFLGFNWSSSSTNYFTSSCLKEETKVFDEL